MHIKFNDAYKIEMYIENTEGFDGEGDIVTKFGVEIRDQATFVVARKRWSAQVKHYDSEITAIRPLEGDLIYLPFAKKLFQIMRVEHESPFYQLKNVPVYRLFCELSSSMIIGDLFFIDFFNYFIQGNNIYPQCYMIHNLI